MHRIVGAKDLIFDVVEETVNLVERTHARISRKTFRPLTVVPPVSGVAQGVEAAHDLTASGVYGAIRLVNRTVRKLVDLGAGGVIRSNAADPETRRTTAQAGGRRSFLADQAQSALNAVCGDYLVKKRNALDIGMAFRHRGQVLPLDRESIARALPDATGCLCVFVHGLGCTESVWRMGGDPDVTFGSRLGGEMGYTPLYVRYNTGRHVSENGRRLSALMERLWAIYPRRIEAIALVGHSMGGLVARSAAYCGNDRNDAWVGKLRHVVSLGSPNLGAPLEKGANILTSLLGFFPTAGTRVPAEILNVRSAGIKDLRFGYTIDAEWLGKDPDRLLENFRQNIPLVNGVGYHYVAGAVTARPDDIAGRLFGDLLVRIPSASGSARMPERAIPFHSGCVLSGMHHMQLARHPDIYPCLRRCLERTPDFYSRVGFSA